MDIKSFLLAINQITEEKGIPQDKVFEIFELAIAAAYKKDYGSKGQIVRAKLDPKTGSTSFQLIQQIVDEDMLYTEEELAALTPEATTEEKKIRYNPERHLLLAEAKKINPKLKVGDELETPLETKETFGRIAAQTAKQVVLQRIREAEKENIYNEFKEKEGEIVSAIVQRIEGRNIFLDVNKALGIMPREEQVPGEFYRPGQRIKVYLLKVEENPKGPNIVLSRAYPKLISKLFELEVPEVSSGQVQIMSIAREPGSRAKIAVGAEVEGIDPIGSMVGQKGTRVMAVINELGGEKVDIIQYATDPEEYIANSLSPAKALEVKILPKNKALVSVPEDQLSLAIGKDGQNVRLAAKLTGWKIDVKSIGEESEDPVEEIEKEELEETTAEKVEPTEESEKEELEEVTAEKVEAVEETKVATETKEEIKKSSRSTKIKK